ncbi:hypothetical protein [Acetobacterium wieringae]|uniref:hypothetical protein n=1 Tax=Acetobacterium wieringae TaxID=52694 RepID=UPI002033E153|nr:hypothetical protein [Acetobacterium wieringae]URN85858.1 hypothetical protein CHL1_001533 [Acetobacterium wieringae]
MSDITIYLCTGLILAGISGASIFIKKTIGDLPDRIHQKNMEQIKHINSKELQIDNYFRQISGKEIETLLFSWTDYISKVWSEDLTGVDVPKMTSDVLRFGSGEAIRRLAVMLQFEFSIKKKEDPTKALDNFVWYYLIAYVVVQLKNDFTGHDIDPTDIIKLRLEDYENKETKNKFKEAQKEAKKLLGI